MNEIITNENIESMIYEIRGKQVMLDSDLAKLYECTNGTKEINQSVKNNLEKFPERYCFRLTKEEYSNLRSKFLTTNFNSKSRTLPRVFTEQGIYMLATILKGKKATKMTLYIMDAFVLMRKYISSDFVNNNILVDHENRILELEKAWNKFREKQLLTIYEGKTYDAYSLLIDIFKSAKEEIIIIDNYANKELFDILRKIEKKIYIISNNLDDILLKKYISQYSNITFINKNEFHDRYIILDRDRVYILGMSLKDLGKRYSYIYQVVEEFYISDLLKRISLNLKNN